MIPTRVHGMLDYGMGLLLIAAPWLLGFADVPAARWVMVIMGVGVIVYSLLTDYELGAARLLSMRAHLLLDVMGGLLLLASPWLFGFADEVRWPHVVLGLLEVGAAALTSRHPTTEHAHHHGRLHSA